VKPIVTHVARADHGEHRYFGERVLSGLLGRETYTGLMALAVLGRSLSREDVEVLDALAVSVTAADPRIWPLKVARLVASYGEMLAGFAAGQLAMMGTYVSPRIIGDAAEQLARLQVTLDGTRGSDAEGDVVGAHVAATPRLAGYGIPLRERDERFDALRAFMARRGRAEGAHWRAQEALSTWIWREKRLAPNIGIGLAAALLDLGCSPVQAGAFATFLIEHTFAANAFEAAGQREPLMQRLPADRVEYVGAPRRLSPRAGRSATSR
jgi:hypothetical protein